MDTGRQEAQVFCLPECGRGRKLTNYQAHISIDWLNAFREDFCQSDSLTDST